MNSIQCYAPLFNMENFMSSETKEKLSEIISKMALLTAACEGNMYHERTVTNEAIYKTAVEIQTDLIAITEK